MNIYTLTALVILHSIPPIETYFADINWNIYNHVNILVIRGHFDKLYNRKVEFLMNFILEINYNLPSVSWIIQDKNHGLPFYVNSIVEQNIKDLPNPFPEASFSCEKIMHRVGPETFTLILADIHHLTHMLNSQFNEATIMNAWGAWLSAITYHGRIVLLQQKMLILATSFFHPSIIDRYPYHKTLYLCPGLLIGMYFKPHPRAIYTLAGTWWPCHNCDIEYQLYIQAQFFKGRLHTYIPEPLTRMPKHLYYKPKLYINLVGGFYPIDNRVVCPGPYKALYRGFIRINKELLCRSVAAASTSILAEVLNLTIVFGDYVSKNWTNIYSHATLYKMHYPVPEESFLQPEVNSYFLNDVLNYHFTYCEPQRRYLVQNFISIICGCFDTKIWICLAITVFAIYLYIQLEYKVESKKVFQVRWEIVLEILQLLMQKHITKNECVRVTCLFTFLITEFFYLASITENLIMPPMPYAMQTLTEVFQANYKLWQPKRAVNENSKEFLKSEMKDVAYQIRHDLQAERFLGNLSSVAQSSRYFWPQLDRTVTQEEIDKMRYEYNPEQRTVFARLWSILRNPVHVQTSTIRKNGTELFCNHVKKRYAVVFEVISVYSRVRPLILSKLLRIYYDTGLRLFWLGMHEDEGHRHEEKQKPDEDKEAVRIGTIKGNDSRFSALIKLCLLGLLLAFLNFLIEDRHQINRCIRNIYSHCRNAVKIWLLRWKKAGKNFNRVFRNRKQNDVTKMSDITTKRILVKSSN